jgi:uncharacterized repeat protein (TIGR01451 family)/CSLREA domain-containing protein
MNTRQARVPLLIAMISLLSVPLGAATITVTTTADNTTVDGNVSLREAITSINNGANLNTDVVAVGAYGTSDTINFNIAGAGVHTITVVTSALPTIVKPVTINGYSQGGAAANTSASADNAVILIQIDGTGLGGSPAGLALGTGSSGSTISGLSITHFTGQGVLINGNPSSNHIITGNFIGVTPAGVAAGNGGGITVTANGAGSVASTNTIGGTTPATRNVISANGPNVNIFAAAGGVANGNIIEGNLIGTGLTGNAVLGASGTGISAGGLANNTIIGGTTGTTPGGACTGACNVISGNGGGISLSNDGTTAGTSVGTMIQGNMIGLGADGTTALGNGNSHNITTSQTGALTIGGTTAAARNVISSAGGTTDGINIFGKNVPVAQAYVIQGNYIGTDTTGALARGNGRNGITLQDVNLVATQVGGTAAGAGNVISNNASNGISISQTAKSVVQGNFIGVAADGTTAAGNTGAGVIISFPGVGSGPALPNNNTIGATTSGGAGGNTIANNAGKGVVLKDQGVNNRISTNSIYANTMLAIDLNADGVTPNDHCDADTGVDNLQNFPVLSTAQTTGSSITINGSLDSTANTTFTLEFFSDSPGTQARTFLGTTTATTNGACVVSFSPTFAVAVPAGANITATAIDPTGNTSELSAAVTAMAGPPTITKTFTPTSIGVNGTSTLTITLTNSAGAPSYTSAAISDTYPAGLVNTASPVISNTCGGSITGGSGGGNTFGLTGGTIPGSGSCSLSITVTSGAANSYSNSTGDLTGSGTTQTVHGAATLTVLNNPTASKAFAPTTIAINGTSTLTITLGNTNASAITGATFADTYPAGLINATPSNVATTCTGGTLAGANGAGTVGIMSTTIPAGGCNVTVTVTSNSANTYNNSLAAGGLTSGNAGSNTGAASATLTVLGPPTGTKAFNPPGIAPGGTSTLTITLNNASGVALTGLSVTDNFPAGLTNATPANASTTCTGGTLTAANGSGSVTLTGSAVPPGGCTITTTVTAAAPGNYTNTINAGQVQTTNAGNNTAAITAQLGVSAPPTVAKAFAPNTIAPGGTSTLTITLTNPNGTSLTGAGFTDTCPVNVVNASPANGATTCGGSVTAANGSGSLALSGGTIPANGACTVTVTITSSTPGGYTNTIGAGAVTTANSGGNTAPASASLTVTPFIAPGVTKAFAPNTIAPGATSTLTITLTNTNGAAITGAAVTDAYPAGVLNATPSNAATTCGGVVTGANGNGSVALTGGTIPANGTCSVTVVVTAPGAGNFVNTIPAGSVTSANAPPSTASATDTLTAVSGAIPALSPMGLVLLSLLLAIAGFVAVRRL